MVRSFSCLLNAPNPKNYHQVHSLAGRCPSRHGATLLASQLKKTRWCLFLMPAMCAMQILKQDWPHRWKSFIPDIIGASRTSETLCENSMIILKLLSEEVFDFSRGELTQASSQVHAPIKTHEAYGKHQECNGQNFSYSPARHNEQCIAFLSSIRLCDFSRGHFECSHMQKPSLHRADEVVLSCRPRSEI